MDGYCITAEHVIARAGGFYIARVIHPLAHLYEYAVVSKELHTLHIEEHYWDAYRWAREHKTTAKQ